MFRRILAVFGVLLWCVAVFFATLWFTFPSETLANRVRHEVPNTLGPEWSAEVESVSPWWLGVSVQGMKLYREGELEDGTKGPLLTAIVEDARIRVRPLSLLRRAPYLVGSVTFPEGTIDWAVGTSVDRQDGLKITDLSLDSDALPLGDLLTFMGDAVPATITGTVALHVALAGGEDGMKDATGQITVEGANVALADLPIPGVEGDVPFSALTFVADVKDGKATLQQGHVASDLISIEAKGDVTLREQLERSSIDLEFVLSNLSTELAMVEGFLGEKGTDGAWHWYCRGVVSRLSISSCTQRERGRTSSRLADRPGSTVRTPGTTADETDDDKERRRAEIQERLQKRREEREAARSGDRPEPTPPDVPILGDDEPEPEPEDEPEDEPVEELPPEEEEPVE